MKYMVFILLISVCTALYGFADVKPPVKKVYAYKQASIPGIIRDQSEANDIKGKRKQNYNYWFYIEIPKSEKIGITGLWIGGMSYGIKTDKITVLPVRKVIFTGVEKNDTIVMVPSTRNIVILIYPSGENKDARATSKTISNLSIKNELVIRYTWKGKTYYSTTRKIKELTPDVRV